MKRAALWVVPLIGLVSLNSLFTGCSLVGLAVDASREPDTLAVGPMVSSLEGKSLLITLRDGSSIAGECQKVGTLPGETYRSRYARWRERPENREFPLSPGETLHVAWDHGKITAGSLQELTPTSVVLLPHLKESAPERRARKSLSIPAEKVDSLWTLDAALLDGSALRRWIGGIPTTGGMIVRTTDKRVWVPLDDVEQAYEIRFAYPWFSRGAIVDAAGLVGAILFFSARDR